MKKLILALTTVTVVLLSSCGEKVSNPLIGKWKLADISLPKVDLTSEVNTQVDSMGVTGVDTAVKAMAKGMEEMTNAMTGMGDALANAFLKGSTYEFKDDGNVEVSILFGSQKGTYSVTPDNKEVTTKIDGKEEKYTITSVDDKALVLTSATGETWTFEAK